MQCRRLYLIIVVDNIESLNIPNDRHEKLYKLSRFKKKDEKFLQKKQEKRA